MKNIKIFAFLAIFLLSAAVSSAWATDVTLTYKIDVQGTILKPVAHIYNAATGEEVASWDHGIKTLWPADEEHSMDDDCQISFTPNRGLDKTDKNENNKSTSTTAFSTEEKETDFQVKVGKEGFYLKSVTFNENNTVKASSPSNIAPNSTSIGVRVPANKFFNYITVVLTVDAYTVSVPENLTISDAFATINRVKYYKAGETVTLTAKENEIINTITGVTASNENVTINLAADRKTATFKMPSEKVTITATTAEVYTVSVPENLTISDAFATISGVNYYKAGKKYTLTLSTTNANEVIDEIIGVEATLEADKKSATFTMPGEDVTISAMTAEVYTVSVPENLTISDVFATISGVKYYKAGEKYTLMLSTTNANEVIDGITGVKAMLEADRKTATFKMPSEKVTITATTAEVYTVSAPDDLTISDAFATIEGVNYYKVGETITLTHSSTNANEIIDGITGVEATLEADKKSATFKMPSENVTITATTAEVYTVSVPDDLTISDAFATISGVNYYKAGETYTLTAKENEIINTITGVTASNENVTINLAADRKTATFKMPGEDVTITATTAEVYTVSVPENLTISDAFATISGVNYYKAGETYTLTLSTTNANEIIDGITGVEATLEVDLKSATFEMPSENVTITATTAEVYTVSVPENLTISGAFATIEGVDYYKVGEKYTLTLSTTNANEIIDGITGVEATLEADLKSATFEMPSENVTITATTAEVYTVSVPENLTISGAFATIESVNYYKVGEKYTLTAKENEIIHKITGVTASNENVTINLAADRKTATFTMPGENVTITATTAEVYTVSVPENLTISDAFATISGVDYYKVGETVTLTLSTTNANKVIDGITGVEAKLEADKKSATFEMPGEDVTISATTAEVYTVSVPENLTISDAFATIKGVNYYKAGETYTLTLSNAKVNEFIDGIAGVTATIAADRKSATFTMPSENVEMSASISKIWGGDDGRDGSKEHPYTIASVSELNELALIVNAGNDFSNTYFEVIKDIVYDVTQTDNGNNYTAIGYDGRHPFNGKFNGKGHTISGIRINKIDVLYQGLFGVLGESAEVENVKLADVEITGNQFTGGIAGVNEGSIRNCTVEKSVKIASANGYVGGVAGFNDGTGTVTGCISSATLTGSGVYSILFGGIVGANYGTVSDNLAINVSVSAPESYGAVVGNNDMKFKLSNNFYTASTVAGVENATNVGTGHGDVTENNGAVSIHAVTLGEGFSVVTPENPIYTDSDQHNYYMAGETLTLEINFAGEKRTATFNMPNRDVEIAATASELHTVTVPEGLDISEPYITIGGIKYYRLGETYTLTLTTAKIDEVIGEITGVTASIANDGKSATFTMPSENVEISATISKILWGGDDGRDGSKEHPYTIASAAELSVLALTVNSGNDFKDTYFEVVEDIVYDITQTDNGNNYTAIGDNKHPFNGKFNGNGHTISGIHINKIDVEQQGLFGVLGESAEVENVKLADVEITGYKYIGGIAGDSKGSIRNCIVEKSVKLAATGADSRFFGGIAGSNYGGTVSGCISSATLTGSGYDSRFFGGIVGDNSGTVTGCISSATLTGSGYDSRFGGIVGKDSKGFISNNIAKNVTVSAPRYYGAVVGDTYNSKLENNFYTACTVNGVENATNVGVDGSDVTENYGAVGISFTEPAAVKDLVYNKLSHELVTAGTTSFGTLLYSLDGENYGTEIPTATDAKTYTVYYRVDKDGENVILPRTIKVSIAKIPLTVTAKNKIIAYGDDPANDGVEYDGFVGEENASVLGGKLSYSYDYKKLDKVGKYTITPSGLTAGNYEITFAAGTLTVEKADVSVEAPVAKEKLVYSGKSQELVTAGKTNFGTLLYSLDGKKYSSEIPAATDAKTYTVYYKVEGSDNWNAFDAKKVEVVIAKAPLTITAKDKSIVYGNEPANDGVEYSGFIGKENASVLGGKLSYSYNYKKLDKAGEYTITPSGLTAGNYEITFAAGTLTVKKADISVEAPVAEEKLVYSGKSQELVTAGKTNFGKLLYSLDGEKYSAEIPATTDAKTYTVYYKVEGSDNWNAFEAKKVEVKIAKADVSVEAPVAKEKLVYSGKSQELVTAGKTNFGTLLYSLDGKKYSSEIPTATDAKTYTVYYKVEGSDNWNAFEAKKVEVKIAKSTAIGRMNARAGRVIKVGADRTFDLKGRPVRGSSNARGAYYKK